MDELSAKQAAFVREYLKDRNATQAAIRAGYSPKGADVQGARLLGNVRVKLAIDAAEEKLNKQSKDIRERIIDELQLLAFSRLSDFMNGEEMRPIGEIDPDKMAALSSFEVKETSGGKPGSEWSSIQKKFKLWSKEKALELLMRHLGMLDDKLKVELPEPVVIKRRNGETIELGVRINGNQDTVRVSPTKPGSAD